MDRVGKADDKAIPKTSFCSELCLTMEILTPLPGVANLKPRFPLELPNRGMNTFLSRRMQADLLSKMSPFQPPEKNTGLGHSDSTWRTKEWKADKYLIHLLFGTYVPEKAGNPMQKEILFLSPTKSYQDARFTGYKSELTWVQHQLSATGPLDISAGGGGLGTLDIASLKVTQDSKVRGQRLFFSLHPG